MPEGPLIRFRKVPENFGPFRGADANTRLKGPCGDTMEFWLKIELGKIVCATYTTDGCVNSLVCGCAAALLAEGKTLEEAKALTKQQVLALAGPVPQESRHCAVLALNTLNAAIEQWENKSKEKESDFSINNLTKEEVE